MFVLEAAAAPADVPLTRCQMPPEARRAEGIKTDRLHLNTSLEPSKKAQRVAFHRIDNHKTLLCVFSLLLLLLLWAVGRLWRFSLGMKRRESGRLWKTESVNAPKAFQDVSALLRF